MFAIGIAGFGAVVIPIMVLLIAFVWFYLCRWSSFVNNFKDMESKLIFIAEEKSFIVEADGKKLRVSYDVFHGNYEEVMEFCKKQGGGDETVENLRFIARYRDAINKALTKFGKAYISGFYWSNEVTWWSDDRAFIVSTSLGIVSREDRDDRYFARAISVL